jgi:hypothetical protein
MKQSSQYIQDFARKLFHHKHGLQSTQLMSPKRDWLLGVLVGLLIMVSMVGWSAYTYIEKRDAIGLNDASVQAEVPVYRSDVVDDALARFAQRKDMFAALNQSGTPVVTQPVGIASDISSTTNGTTTNVLEVSDGLDIPREEFGAQNVTPQIIPPEQAIVEDESVSVPTLVN